VTTTAAPATGTAISRVAALGIAALALAATGCGSSSSTHPANGAALQNRVIQSQRAAESASSASFSWVVSHPAPRGWAHAETANGAVLYYPRDWKRVQGDKGTASAAFTDFHGHIRGYLNATPRQGNEQLANWASFRLRHNAEEGDREVHREASGEELHVAGGHGSCVRDRYKTSTNAEYVELACLIKGPKGSAVIVAAASPSSLAELEPTLRSAISAFEV
jgi:hypothetical protein